MTSVEELFSIRLVVADFYMHRPIAGLDPTYSDFRGQEIKTLPVIRIFGSKANGEKTCMHVHGVFPYFYIPYLDGTVPDPEQLTYQIATSLDKALNISLGQTHSQSQHVFKIQLVKGRPFYGYHNKEHQFLKIFLYSPRFIKRAANLMLNGAILGKSFQPHESHVPFILQFFIDYNLYGMSFLHVPMEVVKYRQSDEYDLPTALPNEQILSQKVSRVSTSRHEVDIAAAFILNRFQLLCKDSGNTNPGIESIWQDERVRRKKLLEDQDVPALEIPCSQERTWTRPTESDIFYRAALRAKLAMEMDGEASLNSTNVNATLVSERKQKFNLVKLLENSVYPSECSQEINTTLANASKVPDHLQSNSLFHTAMRARSKSRSSVSTDNSILDEDLVLSLSQPRQKSMLDQTLKGEDFELLSVMQQLEEDDGDIDLDSTLAPLSQLPKSDRILQQRTIEATGDESLANTCSDDDENDILDYTLSIDSVDKILMELSQPTNDMHDVMIPQLDGGDDWLATPKKSRSTKKNSVMPKLSPRSPKASKYAPLNVTINKSPIIKRGEKDGVDQKKVINITPFSLSSNGKLKRSSIPTKVRYKGALVNLNKEFNAIETHKTNGVSSMELDEESFIVCNLKPRNSPNVLVMQKIKVETNFLSSKINHINMIRLKKCRVRLKRLKSIEKFPLEKYKENIITMTSNDENLCNNISDAHENESIDNETKNDQIKLKIITEEADIESLKENQEAMEEYITADNKICDKEEPVEQEEVKNLDANGFIKPEIRAVEVKLTTPNRRKSWSPTHISREFDRQKNYYPKPGPSGLKKKRSKKKVDVTPAPKRQTRLATREQQKCDNMPQAESDNDKEDLNICSFYEKSFIVDSPSTSIDILSSQTPTVAQEFEPSSLEGICVHSILTETTSPLVCITPRQHPPTFAETMERSVEFGIPDEVFTEPFYGDDADVTNKREVGHTVLHIPGKSLNACQSFESILPNLKGIEAWRKSMLEAMLGENMTKNQQNAASVKEYFSSREKIKLSTKANPPTRNEAKEWLLSLEGNCKKILKPNENDDSPIKVRKEKIKMMFDESILHDGSGDYCDFTQKSVSLSPLTPDNIKPKKTELISSSKSKVLTPIKRISDQKTPLSALQKFRERRKSRARLSLAKKLSRLGSGDSTNSGTDSELGKNARPIVANEHNSPQLVFADESNDSEKLSQRSFGSEQMNDLCSEKVMQILERTSFVRNLPNVDYGEGSDVSFGLSGATLDNTFGFKISLENLKHVKADVQHNYLTVFSLEIHVNTRGELRPDPQHDSIDCLFFSISSDCQESVDTAGKTVGCIMVCDNENAWLNGVHTRIVAVKSEMELFNQLLYLCKEWNPDILVGYEIEMHSWGYLIDRAQVLGMNLKALLSRVPTQKVRDIVPDEEKEAFTDLDVELKLCGRILLDVWRLMRSEIALTSYTFENVMFHILHRRCPLHSFRNLTKWYSASNTRWVTLEYYLQRVNGTMELLEQLDLIGRTSEMAKLIGIQFYEVLSRGSQFRVESMMLRIAKPKNLVPVSPSIQQRAHSRAPEYLPLILEPKSRFYADPMIVLDFQSLYPSMIIAYNYCFSTCLGRVEHLGQSTPFEFGCSQLRVSKNELNRLIDNDLVTISPCGVVFVKKEVREGVLPRMLKEILDTRIMVKQSMKLHKTNSTLQRVLHSRQLGLKLMANVTYGYTSANFSGRMACVEVADSVVGKGRETLERAIRLVESNENWRAKVVYGDTDSLFVLVPGRSRADAFKIGAEIAEAVTNENPQPVKLKLEKVYHPCILQTKKRYVGYMYESADQEMPTYEAKGIETVRRDGCPAVAKILEKCIRILFESCDVSQIKRYVCRQFTKLLTGNANVQDLIFAKEFRGKNGYKPGACVPALELTRKWLQTDPRSEPRRGERVPFLIVNGPPGLPLIRLVRSPHEYLADEGLKINAIYYITKAIIPPLNRCLLLIGADVHEWFADLPRKHIALPTIGISTSSKRIFSETKKSTISQYFASSDCIIDCGRHTKAGICISCMKNKQKCSAVLSQKISKLERGFFSTKTLCQSCCGRLNKIDCSSLDCPILFVANLKEREWKQVQHFENILRDKILNSL